MDPEQRRRGLTRISAGSPVRDLEVRLRTKQGGKRVCVLSADIVVLDGRTCILMALTDITDRVRAEEALRESEQRFILAFHANPLPMSITRLPDGVHLEVNEAAVRHGGFTREEILGRTKAELGFWVTPEQRDTMIRQLAEHGVIRDVEVEFRTRSGGRRQLLVNAQNDLRPRPRGPQRVRRHHRSPAPGGGQPRPARGGGSARGIPAQGRPGEERVPRGRCSRS